jgi:uncharacterized protein
MPHTRPKHPKRLDQRGPLVFDTRTLGPGSARTETRTAPAPGELGAGLISVPERGDLELEVQLEGVTEGVLVTAAVTAPLAGECARCLDRFTSTMDVRFQELFGYPADSDDDDAEEYEYLLDGDLLDLEPALRDALVLELPLSPLCAADCQGLCSECGARLADAGPGHGHATASGVWAALKDFRVAGTGADSRQDSSAPDGAPVREEQPDGTTAPGQSKER